MKFVTTGATKGLRLLKAMQCSHLSGKLPQVKYSQLNEITLFNYLPVYAKLMKFYYFASRESNKSYLCSFVVTGYMSLLMSPLLFHLCHNYLHILRGPPQTPS